MTAPANVRTCYRHPDRVAGISCQRCDRPICPSCMHQASVGFHCPECAKAGKQKVYQGIGSLTARPLVTQVLIGINVLAFIAMLATSGDDWVFVRGALWGPAIPTEPWRLVTGGFLHSNDIPFGFIHIGMNMYFVWVLGQLIERSLGPVRYLALYAAALLGGSLGVVLLDPDSVTVGASGAAYGLMGAAFLVGRERGIDLMRSGLMTTLVINLVITFSVPGISIGGHIGGLVAGGLAGLVLVEVPKRIRSIRY
jgi:membrane associated rhomboid family serine protease